jgi:hypothetical protein
MNKIIKNGFFLNLNILNKMIHKQRLDKLLIIYAGSSPNPPRLQEEGLGETPQRAKRTRRLPSRQRMREGCLDCGHSIVNYYALNSVNQQSTQKVKKYIIEFVFYNLS